MVFQLQFMEVKMLVMLRLFKDESEFVSYNMITDSGVITVSFPKGSFSHINKDNILSIGDTDFTVVSTTELKINEIIKNFEDNDETI